MYVKNWDKWQSYRKGRGTPGWIKVHRNLMTNEQWVSLTDAERGQLVSIWILAADKCGTIPDDPALIQRMAMLSSKPDINKFKDLDFLVTSCQPSGDQVAASWQPSGDQLPDTVSQSGCSEEKRREEKRREESSARKRATRLPSDWQPNEQDIQYCKTKRPDLNPEVVAENFRDYWISKPGGTKLDWSATWRTWVRKEDQQLRSHAAQQQVAQTASPTHTVVDFKKLREAEKMLDPVDPYEAFR